MGTVYIGKKEFEIKEETADKIERFLDFAAEKLPFIVSGAGIMFLWGYFSGNADGYKRGLVVGDVNGRITAYTQVLETIRMLKQ